MESLQHGSCAICGSALEGKVNAFGVMQDFREDRVRVFAWEDVGCVSGIRGACCVGHVRELVVHWMVTERLDYPFAEGMVVDESNWQDADASQFGKAVPLGELSVDHESVRRIAQEDANWLAVILNELDEALRRAIEQKTACLPRDVYRVQMMRHA